MNQASASNVLSNLGADLPNHLRNETNAAQEILSGALGGDALTTHSLDECVR